MLSVGFFPALVPGSVRAHEFPWLEPANTQVVVIQDPYVDFALRIAAIDRAHSSVDSITYLQSADAEIGMPMLQAFRRAQGRGLSGRYLTARIGSMGRDPRNRMAALLADTRLAQPGEVIGFGGLKAWRAGFSLTDMVHEKMLILDAGTPDEVIWIGGRNNTVHSITDLDFGVVLRRLDPDRPYVGDQIRAAFEDTWGVAKIVQPPRLSTRSGLVPGSAHHVAVELAGANRRLEFERLDAFLRRRVDPTAAPAPFESRPARMRAINNEFLGIAATRIYGRTMRRRAAMPSDIVDAAAAAVAGARRIHLAMMSVFLPGPLKAALKTALKDGAEVHLLTNSRESHRSQAPMGVPFDFSLADILELMETGGKLSVHVMDLELIRRHPDAYKLINYLHQKVLVADSHVFIGSDNFNDNSRARNSEMVLQLDDAEFAGRIVGALGAELEVFRRLECEAALTERGRYGLFRRGLNRLLLPFY